MGGWRVSEVFEEGFTLVEVMIVIAIVAILAAVAIPNYESFMAQRRLNGAARQIMSDLMHARMQAISQNNEFKVSFPNDHEYQILDDDNNSGSTDSGENLQTRNIQTDYHDVTFTKTANPIFYARGSAYGTTITVNNASGSKHITVAITGRVVIGS